MSRVVFILEPLPGASVIDFRQVKSLLKRLIRDHRLRCLAIRPARPGDLTGEDAGVEVEEASRGQ